MGRYWLAAIVWLTMANAAAAAPVRLDSPDGRVAISIATDERGTPTYSVRYRGRELIAPSALGLRFEQYREWQSGMEMRPGRVRVGEDRYRLVGKIAEVRDAYREMVVHFTETGGERRRMDIVLRAYDDGVAFRYHIPAQPQLRTLRLVEELTQFRPTADHACHGLNLGNPNNSHEGEYDPVRISHIRPHHMFELPLVCAIGDGDAAIAFAEADLRDYAGLFLSGFEGGGLALQARLAPRHDDPAIAVRREIGPEGLDSPWRLIMIADHPGRLIESTLVTSLNPPAEGDFSWVRPGKSAWDWWNGPSLASVPQAGMNHETIRAFVDFAADNGLEFMLIDDGWYVNGGAGGTLLPGADPLRPVEALDLPAILRHAAERDVGIWLWVHWRLLERNMDEVLALYARWGVKGIKVDFMDRTDQDMVDFYHRLLRTAAANRLLVNLHGAYRPTGLIRTYPNYLTQEGVLGAEYNKWSRRITARHNVTLPYTRMLLGPMDYTPGGFRNATPETFEPRNVDPMTMTTRGHGLAMYVVYDSPFQTVADTPDAYRGEPGLDFLRLVPAAWDETRFVAGEIGEYVVIARRRGRDWYVGAMTNEAGRDLRLPLGFLGDGRYAATIWRDGETPTALVRETSAVTAGDSLDLRLAPSGGAALRLTPE